jgi:hypothetical protein
MFSTPRRRVRADALTCRPQGSHIASELWWDSHEAHVDSAPELDCFSALRKFQLELIIKAICGILWQWVILSSLYVCGICLEQCMLLAQVLRF